MSLIADESLAVKLVFGNWNFSQELHNESSAEYHNLTTDLHEGVRETEL